MAAPTCISPTDWAVENGFGEIQTHDFLPAYYAVTDFISSCNNLELDILFKLIEWVNKSV